MKLSEWIDKRVKGKACEVYHPVHHTRQCTGCKPRGEAYAYLAEATGISDETIANVDRGMRLKTYDRAKAIEAATKGLVTVQELCE